MRLETVLMHALHQKLRQIFVYSRYYAEACNLWRGPSSPLSSWATQFERIVAKVASRMQHCVWFDGLGIEPKISRR